MNNLSKVVARKWNDRESNSLPFSRKSNVLTIISHWPPRAIKDAGLVRKFLIHRETVAIQETHPSMNINKTKAMTKSIKSNDTGDFQNSINVRVHLK